jgi:hypothetical protein
MDLVIAGGQGLGLTLPERHEIAAIVAALVLLSRWSSG